MANLDPSRPPQEFLAQILDKMTGMEKPVGDEIRPTVSPIDFLPYEKPVSMGLDKLAKLQAISRLYRSQAPVESTVMEKAVFDPANKSHIDAIKPSLEKYLPHSGDDDYSNGELIHYFLKTDPNRRQEILKMPEVQRSINESGFKLKDDSD